MGPLRLTAGPAEDGGIGPALLIAAPGCETDQQISAARIQLRVFRPCHQQTLQALQRQVRADGLRITGDPGASADAFEVHRQQAPVRACGLQGQVVVVEAEAPGPESIAPADQQVDAAVVLPLLAGVEAITGQRDGPQQRPEGYGDSSAVLAEGGICAAPISLDIATGLAMADLQTCRSRPVLDLLFIPPSSRGTRLDLNQDLPMEITALHTIQSLAGRIAVRKLAAGELLFDNQDPGSSIFAVLSGAVAIHWPHGSQEQLAPGQLFGIGALVEADHRRHGSARAIEASEVIELNREEFLFAIQESPMFALQVMAALEERMRRLRDDV